MPASFRTYHKYNPKLKRWELECWMNKRCKKCGKFLKKKSRLYCSKHSYLNKLKNNRKFRKKKYYNNEEYRLKEIQRSSEVRRKSSIMQEYIKLRNFVCWHIKDIEVGDIIDLENKRIVRGSV